MSEKEKAETGKQENGEFTLDLSFAPSWARTSPEDNLQKFQKERYSDDYEPRRGGRDFKRERRAPREFEGGEQRRGDRRPPRRDFERGPSRDSQSQPRPASRGPRPEGGFRGPRAEEGFRGPRPEGDGRGGRDPRRGPVDRAPALPLEIRILPEQKALGACLRRGRALSGATG